MAKIRLHEEDFIEMLERGDAIERIAAYCGITNAAVCRRFQRLPDEVKEQIRKRRKIPIGSENRASV